MKLKFFYQASVIALMATILSSNPIMASIQLTLERSNIKTTNPVTIAAFKSHSDWIKEYRSKIMPLNLDITPDEFVAKKIAGKSVAEIINETMEPPETPTGQQNNNNQVPPLPPRKVTKESLALLGINTNEQITVTAFETNPNLIDEYKKIKNQNINITADQFIKLIIRGFNSDQIVDLIKVGVNLDQLDKVSEQELPTLTIIKRLNSNQSSRQGLPVLIKFYADKANNQPIPNQQSTSSASTTSPKPNASSSTTDIAKDYLNKNYSDIMRDELIAPTRYLMVDLNISHPKRNQILATHNLMSGEKMLAQPNLEQIDAVASAHAIDSSQFSTDLKDSTIAAIVWAIKNGFSDKPESTIPQAVARLSAKPNGKQQLTIMWNKAGTLNAGLDGKAAIDQDNVFTIEDELLKNAKINSYIVFNNLKLIDHKVILFDSAVAVIKNKISSPE